MIKIKEVKTRRQARLFTNFPNKMYKNVDAFVPALSLDEMNVFNPKKNAAHRYVSSIRFLAYKNNVLVGRIAGLINHQINYQSGKDQVRFTRLDMIDDIEVTKALINAVETWGNKLFGLNKIIGPIGFTDFDRQGLLIDGFDELNLFITIYNFPYYQVHLEKLGFKPDVDWLEKRITWPSVMPEKVERGSKLVQRRYGYRLYKPKTKKDIDNFLYEAFDVYNNAFKELYGFHSINNDVVDYYVKQVIPFIQLDWVWVVYDKKDNIAGFGIVMPSMGKANKKNHGKLFPFGWIRLLRSIKKYDTVDFYFIAVAPEYQNTGVTAIIFEDAMKMGIKHGVKFAETGPELASNNAIHNQWNDFEFIEHKKRRCYVKDITLKD